MAIPRINVAFRITGFDCDPDDVTQCLGVEPSATWRIGDLIEPSTVRRKSNGWVLSAPLIDPLDIEVQIKWLLDQLPVDLRRMSQVTDRWDAELSCALYIKDQAPALALSSETVQRLADLAAEFDADLYVIE